MQFAQELKAAATAPNIVIPSFMCDWREDG
jgi:hypothetical protein